MKISNIHKYFMSMMTMTNNDCSNLIDFIIISGLNINIYIIFILFICILQIELYLAFHKYIFIFISPTYNSTISKATFQRLRLCIPVENN